MANVYDIIIRPIITERSMEATGTKKYVFEVAPTAGKIEIKNAVEQIFGVKVAKVTPSTMMARPSAWALPVPAAARAGRKLTSS